MIHVQQIRAPVCVCVSVCTLINVFTNSLKVAVPVQLNIYSGISYGTGTYIKTM
jgi:hypothetical protein